MRAAGRALLRVVHRSVDPDFLDRLRGWGRKRVADRQIDRSAALLDAARAVIAYACAVDDTRRRNLAGALTIEEVAGIHAVQQKPVAGIALTVGPDRCIAQAGVDPSTARQFRIDAGRKDRDTGETAGRQRNCFNLRPVENIPIRGVDGIEQRVHIDFHGVSYGAHFQLRRKRDGAVGLNQNARIALGRKAFPSKGHGVFANGQIVNV